MSGGQLMATILLGLTVICFTVGACWDSWVKAKYRDKQ